MMHTIRLLQVAAGILEEGVLKVKRANRNELLAVKSGAYDYDELLEKADGLMQRIETAYSTSSLPERPDLQKTESTLVNMRATLYR